MFSIAHARLYCVRRVSLLDVAGRAGIIVIDVFCCCFCPKCVFKTGTIFIAR